MRILDNIYGVLFKPSSTFSELPNRQYLGGSFLIVLLVSIINAMTEAAALNIGGVSVPILTLISVGFYLLFWIFSSLFLSFAADFMGGAGKITDTMIGLAYALLPTIFLGPLFILTNSLGMDETGIYNIFKILIYLWTLSLIIISLKNAHRFHTTQAILSVVSIFFIILGLTFATIMLSVLGGAFYISIL